MPVIAPKFDVKAVGVTFMDGYPDFLHRLAPAVERALRQKKRLEAWLVREKSNPHDVNAIAVEVPEIGRIGHVPRSVAEKLAPLIDAGETWTCVIGAVLIHPDHTDRPGIDLHIERFGNRDV